MDIKATAVFGVFQDVSSLKTAVASLRKAGYSNTAVSVLFPDKRAATNSIVEKQPNATEDFALGLRIGAVVGGVFGLLTGSGAFDIPELDSFVISGPVVATLAGIGMGGIIGGTLGALVHLKVRVYGMNVDEACKTSGFLLVVDCDNRDCAQRAEVILKNTGADAVSFNGRAAA